MDGELFNELLDKAKGIKADITIKVYNNFMQPEDRTVPALTFGELAVIDKSRITHIPSGQSLGNYNKAKLAKRLACALHALNLGLGNLDLSLPESKPIMAELYKNFQFLTRGYKDTGILNLREPLQNYQSFKINGRIYILIDGKWY